MKRYITLGVLALLAFGCSLVEGLVDALPAQFIQFNGLLTLLSTAAFIVTWLTVIHAEDPGHD